MIMLTAYGKGKYVYSCHLCLVIAGVRMFGCHNSLYSVTDGADSYHDRYNSNGYPMYANGNTIYAKHMGNDMENLTL